MNEYYYISFTDCEIYSWQNENTEMDKANHLIGNRFDTYQDAKNFLKTLLGKQKIS